MTDEALRKRKRDVEKDWPLIQETVNRHFGAMSDPRRAGSIKHRLIEIIFITLCATLCGANDLEAVVEYAEEKQEWLKLFLALPKGVPCYGTFW